MQNSVNNANGSINWHIKGPDPKIPKFSGLRRDFSEWKSSFCMLMDSYPDNIRVPTLKEHLDPGSLSLVAYISVTEPNAYEQIWQQLDRKYQQGLGDSHYHNGQLLQLIRRKRCSSVADLESVYNTFKYHWSKLCKMGPQYAAYGDSILIGMSEILYGQSQAEVDRLAFENRNFNVPSVLNAIWSHIGQASTRLSNHQLAEEMAPKPEPGNPRRSHSPTGGGHYSRNYKVSFTEHRDKRNDSPYPRSPTRSTSPTTSRDSSPAHRGQSARSPSPRGSRSPRVFKCNFCKVNDHSYAQCAKFTAEQYLRMANEQQLCYVCMMPGHTAWVCPVTISCETSACKHLNRHAALICKALLNVTQK